MNHDVQLRIEGSLLERLINRALQAGASFARIRRSGKRIMLVSTDEHSAVILTSLCEKYFLDCRILRRSGMPALRDTVRRRWTLLPALLLCTILGVLFLSRIWLVDIRFNGPRPELGNQKSIRSLLEQNDIKPGISAAQIDSDRLQKQLLSAAGNYSYIGVRRQGIRLLVEAAPEVPSPDTFQIGYARDLIASRDGVVESISVLAGSACVKPGDTVHAGQTLIRGEEAVATDAETREEITAPVGALGEVVARCWYEGSASGYIESEMPVRTGQKSMQVRLKLINHFIPLVEGESYSRFEAETEHTPIVGLFLPLELEKTTRFETRTTVHTADPETLQKQLEVLARADALKQLSGDGIPYQIASHWTDAKQDDNTLRLRAVYEIYTDIATTRDAFIEEVY